jgi:hypothetical protein
MKGRRRTLLEVLVETNKTVSHRARLRLFLKDPDRKPMAQMLCEIIQLWMRNGISPIDYYSYLMFKKDVVNMQDYVGSRASKIREHLDDSYYSWFSLLDNKLYFHLFFADKPIRIPRLLGYSFGSRVFANGEELSLAGRDECVAALQLIASMSNTGSVFAKPTDSLGGQGVYRFSADEITNMVARDYHNLVSADYIFEETILQHDTMSVIHPHSVNTLRIDTFRDENGNILPISAYMRMGTGGHYADNASTGGCFAGIDLFSGMLKSPAMTLPKMGGRRFSEHPDSGVAFEHFRVPLFSQTVMLVCDAARIVPQRLVGWDVAVADDGPILIEGNPNYDTRVSELAFGGYRKNPVYRKVLAEYGHSR